MSRIADFVQSTAGFYRKSAVDQLLLLAWFAESREGKSSFDGAYLRQCFNAVGVDPPDMSVYLPRLSKKKPPQLLKVGGGYRLAAQLRREFDTRIGGDSTTIAISRLLEDLPQKIPDLAERDFLKEALSCYRVKAYRATIVMTWNLAYDHFARWMLKDSGRLQSLNMGIANKFPKKGVIIKAVEDIQELKESELIDAARAAHLIDKNTYHILKDKLTRRNTSAHPSVVTITQHQADDAVSDLVNNVVLKFT